MSVVGNTEFIAATNTRLVLQSVRIMQPTFRAAVARHTGLNPATVTGIVQNLLERRVLQEIEAPPQPNRKREGGRPPKMLRVNMEARQVLAVDLEPDCLRVALTNLLAEPLETRERLIDRRSDSRLIVRQILELCAEVMAGKAIHDLMGVGLCLPGLIDSEAGVAISSTNMPNWRDVPIVQMLQNALDVPVKMGRSMHLAALHERWLHPELEERRVVVLSLRTGIGMSLTDGGRIRTRQHDFAGEIGHTVIDLNGLPCECGNRGCLETFVSASAVIERAQRMLKEGRGAVLQKLLDQGEPLRPELIYRLAQTGDTDCAAIVRDVARYIGLAAANLINLLAPDHLVICGSIDMADALILDEVRKQVEQRALPRLRRDVCLRLASAKEKAPLLGAAVLVARQAFELPEIRGVTAPDDEKAHVPTTVG